MRALLLLLTLICSHVTAIVPLYAATYKGTITIEVGELQKYDIGYGYMGSNITVSGFWSKSNSTFVFQSTSQKECTIKGNQVGSGKLYWNGYIFGDAWDFYWDVYVVPAEIKVSSISLSPTTMNLEVGKSQYISETVYPSNATNKSVSWSSSPTGIVTVSSTGEVKAIKEGTTTVTCKANDGSGKYATCKVTVTKPDVVVAEINVTNFPDENFRNYLLGQDYGKDGKLTQSELNNVTYLDVENKGINNLKGVEYFTALTSLRCSSNSLTFLDISKNVKLEYLYCERNKLSSINLSYNKSLVYVNLHYNKIQNSFMDEFVNSLPKNTSSVPHKLMLVNLFYNSDGNVCTKAQIANIKAKGWTPYCYTAESWVEYEGYDENQLVAINKENFPDDNFRKWIVDYFGQAGVLTVHEIENTETLFINDLDISSLKGIEYFTNLTLLQCYNCNLTSVDISKNTKLKDIVLTKNQLKELDVSKNTSLERISCGWNLLKTLDVSKLTSLTSLYCGDNPLTSLDVSKNTALTMLSCENSDIKGAAMDNLICSLPRNTTGEVHRFRVVGEDLSNESNVCTTTQVAAVKAKGWFPCYYDSTTKEYVEYEGSDDTPTTKGDVNGDNQVNGTDLVALTNIILGKNAQTTAADVNGDGYVNGTDYVALANIVLGRSNAQATAMAKGAIQAVATTGLSIEPFDIKAGESKEMVIDLTNPSDDITLVQFDLRLPKGLSVKQSSGEYDFDIAGRTTWRKHSLDANATNGIVRFLLASSSNATLTGTEGAIIKITITADNSFTGGDIQLENILMVTPAEKEIKQDVYTYHVGQSQQSPASTGLAIEPFSISAGGEAEMVIDMTNPDDEITLVQFDLRLPAGLSVKQTGGDYDYDIAGRTTWRKHSLDANATNGIVRFLLASSSNATLTGTEGAIIKIALKADNTFAGGAVKLENILLVTPAEKEIKQPNVNYNIGTTGVKSVAADDIKKDATIYNLSGQRLDKPRKGINIIGGKKVMVK